MAGEKRFEPSRKKLLKARQEGDVAKSREFSGGFALLAGVAAIVFRLPETSSDFIRLLEHCLGAGADFQSNNMLVSLRETTLFALRQLVPPLSAVWLALLLLEMVQVGVMFSWEVLHWKWSRISFLSGFRRIVGFNAESESSLPLGLLYESTKCLAFVIGAGAVGGWVLFYGAGLLAYTDLSDNAELGGVLAALVPRVLAPVAAVVVLLGAADWFIARYRLRCRLRMDIDELRRDLRESEGDAETKGMRKQLHQELLVHGILEGVRKANVVVVGRRESSS